MKLCLLKMKLVVITVFFLFTIITAQGDSPCPQIFNYRAEGGMPLYGIIAVTAPGNFQGALNLETQISIGNLIGDTQGSIELMTPNSQVPQVIEYHRPLLFKVNFPYWINIKPKVTKILVDGNVVCVGEPVYEDQVRHTTKKITTLNLKFQLRISNYNSQNTIFNMPVFTYPSVNQPAQQRPSIDPFNHENTVSPQKPVIVPAFVNPTVTEHVPIQTPPVAVITSSNSISNSCGRRTETMSAVIPLIVGGEELPEGSNPWLAALFKLQNGRPQFICGSTVISTSHVITAAHCVHGVEKRKFHLALGTNDIYNWAEFTKRTLSYVYVHPGYIANSADADVAVLIMSEEVQFNTKIAPACIWNNNNNLEGTVGTTGVVAGWGIDESGSVTAKPKQISMPIVSEETCLRSAAGFFDVTSNRTFCAGSRDNRGPCNGDSGGGFYVEMNSRWYIRGIVSHALITENRTCDLSNYLVFTDIAQHREWIMSKL